MPEGSTSILLYVSLWIGLAALVGDVAYRRGRSMLRWFLIAMFFSAVVAVPLLLISIIRSPKGVDDSDVSPYGVESQQPDLMRAEVFVAHQTDRLQQWVSDVYASTTNRFPLRSRRMAAFVAVLILILLAPTVWYTMSLQASPEANAVTPVVQLPPELQGLEWQAPQSISLTIQASPAQTHVGGTPEATGMIAKPIAETGRVLHMANVREGPGTDYPIVDQLDQDQIVELVAQNSEGDWYQIASGDWLAAFLVARIGQESLHVSGSTTEPMNGQEGAVTVAEAYVRSGPGTGFDIVDSLYMDDHVQISGINAAGDWLRLANGRWIYAELLDTSGIELDQLPAVVD